MTTASKNMGQLRKHRHQVLWLLTAFTMVNVSNSASAGITYQDINTVRAAILQFAAKQQPYGKALQARIGKIDPRLRLAPCSEPLNPFFPSGVKQVGNTTIGVECNGSSPWKIYVPVTLTTSAPMVINTRALARGTVLQHSDLQVIQRDVTYLQDGFYTEPSQVIGMVVERPLRQGSILSPKNLQPRVQVKRGDIVSILAETSGIQVYVKGHALMDGHHGQEIRVRNQSTRTELQAEVVGPGQVQVKM